MPSATSDPFGVLLDLVEVLYVGDEPITDARGGALPGVTPTAIVDSVTDVPGLLARIFGR